MDYMREINAFYDWLATNPQITDSARNLWHALMHTANRAGWITEFAVAVSTLEAKTGMSRAALYRARNALKQAGRIDFSARGGNQCAAYSIFPFASPCETQGGAQSVAQTVHTTEHKADTPRDHYSSYPTDTRKTKTKTKTNTPDAAAARWEAYRTAVENRSFAPPVAACALDWLTYKTERREKYTGTGLAKLLSLFGRNAVEHGEEAVIYAVDQSIANGWQGIVWDKARGAPRTSPRTAAPSRDVEYVSCDGEEV